MGKLRSNKSILTELKVSQTIGRWERKGSCVWHWRKIGKCNDLFGAK